MSLSLNGKRLIVLFANGDGCALARDRLSFDDGSPVTGVEIFDHGCAVAVRLASGASYDLPWDSIRHYAAGGARKPLRVGVSIRRLRDAKNISQVRLAAAAKLSRVHLSRIESGTSEPGLDTLERIAKALGVRIADFFPLTPLSRRRAVALPPANSPAAVCPRS